MKKIFLSFTFIFSLLSLNPLLGMESDKNQASNIQAEPDKDTLPDKETLILLSKQIEALTQAVNDVDTDSLPKDKTRMQKFLACLSPVLNTLSKVPAILSKAPEKTSAVFSWLSTRLDTILTQKGAIKFALLFGPIFATYCYYCPPEFLSKMLQWSVAKTAEGAGVIANAAAMGLVAGIGNAIKQNKDELSALVLENKEEIKNFYMNVTSELAKIKAEAEINANFAKAEAPFSSWNLFGQSTALTAASALGTSFALILKTVVEALAKKSMGIK